MDVAVLGCGRQGQLHIGALQRTPGFCVRAICDVDALTLERVHDLYPAPHAFNDYRELLAKQPVDVVVVCTMPDSHRDIVVAALGAGAHVVCEKPFALDRHEAADMLRAAKRCGRLLTAGFNLRYSKMSKRAESLIAGGHIGRPLFARLRSRSGLPAWGNHHVRAISGGGVLAGSAVHLIDLGRWFGGQLRPLRASAFVSGRLPEAELTEARLPRPARWDCDNVAFGMVRFEGGFCLFIDAEWVAGMTSVRHEVEVVGDRARIALVPFDSSERAARDEGLDGGDGPHLTPDRALAMSIQREWAALAEALRAGKIPSVTCEDAVVVQAIVDALYESSACQGEVDVDLSGLSTYPLGPEKPGHAPNGTRS